jgi:uncharacterized protein
MVLKKLKVRKKMSKYISLLVALMATFITASALAFTPPPAPDQGWYVVDQTGRMSTPEISALNQKILRVSQATHNEFGVAFIQSLEGDSIEDAAYDTFKKWGIGKHGLDNGVLIIVSLKDHKSRIETGKGVGGEITDLQSKQILDNTMRPRLKAGHFADAFSAAIDDLSGLMESRANQKATPLPAPAAVAPVPESSSSGGWIAFLFCLPVFGIGIFFFWLIAKSRREENEREAKYQRDRRSINDHWASKSTIHHTPGYARSSVPLTPAPVPVVVDNTSSDVAVAAIATAALLESERESRAERRHEKERKERQVSRQETYSAPDPSPSYNSDPTPSIDITPTPDTGGGFSGGDSGGGGASGSW